MNTSLSSVIPLAVSVSSSPWVDGFFTRRKLPLVTAVLVSFIISIFAGFFGYNQYLSPKALLLRKLDAVVYLVQNPDPVIVSQYNFSPDRIKSNQQPILDGYASRSIPGLFDARVAIEQGDMMKAKLQLEKIFKTFLLDRTVLSDGTDRVVVTDVEKKIYDPDYHYFTRDAADTFSAINKDVGLETLRVLSQL